MNQEKINEAAEGIYPTEYIGNIKCRNVEGHAFKNGTQYAAANPDVIDCVSMEEMFAFVEWVGDAGWKFLDKEGYWTDWNGLNPQTTEELYQIYKQKP